MSVNSKMTAIANAIRSLLGITGTLGLDAMATKLNSITKKTAATYTPGTADQTIAKGQYLSGAQTIKGDANLLPANIAKDVTIFGVKGEHEGGGVNTCTVTLKAAGEIGIHTSNKFWYACTRYVDGAIVPDGNLWVASPAVFPLTIQNVVCGSALYVRIVDADGWLSTLGAAGSNGSTMFTGSPGYGHLIISVTNTPNVTDEITITGWT